jgi:hypothetical protein
MDLLTSQIYTKIKIIFELLFKKLIGRYVGNK